MSTPWGGLSLTAVADTTGNATQLYPASCSAGSGATTKGTQIRRPMGGVTTSISIQTDGTDGGIIEIWDVCGSDGGADVNTLAAITATQLNALVAAGMARLIWSENFTGTSAAPMRSTQPINFVHGLAARYINSTGTCKVNVFADGGFCYTTLI